MGFKFGRFRAKLHWKKKEKVPEVLCLNYQIKSEFDLPQSVPSSNNEPRQLEIIETAVKPEKSLEQPTFQDIFKTEPHNDVNSLSDNNETLNKYKSPTSATDLFKNDSKLSDMMGSEFLEDQITKHPETDHKICTSESLKDSSEQNNRITSELLERDQFNTDCETDSYLIFMTENHDDVEEFADVPISENHEEFLRVGNVGKDERKNHSQSEDEDGKTVRWRETVIEIQPNEYPNDSCTEDTEDDFQVHFANCNINRRTIISESDIHESDEEEEEEVEEEKDIDMESYFVKKTDNRDVTSMFFGTEKF